MNIFLYPNIKDTRKLLSFLFEIIFKGEDDKDNNEQSQQPSNEFEVLMKRRMLKWKGKPWIMPDFVKMKRNLCISNGDKIIIDNNIDFERVSNCKSKKAKGVYELMTSFKSS